MVIYGYEIMKQLCALDFSNIVEGTVYTLIMRLEENKLVDIDFTRGPPRKFYRLNEAVSARTGKFLGQIELYLKQTKRIKSKIKSNKHEYFC
ncbi:PadR family transcriptional regulator [Virgibacillus ndiopensis]|uniref:PadR family transcriptional regulator n=1 Tax=Virgibacillus ndiopensis TaxID=2004408 RepID=UPI003CCB8B2A